MLASKFYSFELLLVKAIIFRCFLSEIIRFPIFCVCSFLHFLCLIRALIFPTPTTAVKTTTNNRKRQRQIDREVRKGKKNIACSDSLNKNYNNASNNIITRSMQAFTNRHAHTQSYISTHTPAQGTCTVTTRAEVNWRQQQTRDPTIAIATIGSTK